MESNYSIRIYYTRNTKLEEVIKKIRGTRFANKKLYTRVQGIIEDVKKDRDRALLAYTEKFDKLKLTIEDLQVTCNEIKDAYSKVSEDELAALEYMKSRVERFEKKLLKRNIFPIIRRTGLTISNELRPLHSVGCYVPGGKATYPSSLIMSVVPAKTAGVPRIVVCTPPMKTGLVNPLVLVAGNMCGVNEFYRVGGAQAVAALAMGTETIQPVNKVVGPGNIYVTTAKLLLSHIVAIDTPAGPSELLIIADNKANPNIVVRDLISQAEHGEESICGVITTSSTLADRIIQVLTTILPSIHKSTIVTKALTSKGFLVICKNIDEAIEFTNLLAPEHLEILVNNPHQLVKRIKFAGLILVGPYSPVAASDYCVGTNHILPTGGFAKSYSGLSSLDFFTRLNVIQCSKKYLESMRQPLRILASSEGLYNHSAALEERFKH